MKLNFLTMAFIVIILSFLVGCTDNQRAKTFGGTATINLPPKTKLVTVTWKEADLWYLTRPMKEDEEPETYTFNEDSQWGLLEGTVIIQESK